MKSVHAAGFLACLTRWGLLCGVMCCWTGELRGEIFGWISLTAGDTDLGDSYYWPSPHTQPIVPVDLEHNVATTANVNGIPQVIRNEKTSGRLTSVGTSRYAHLGVTAKASQSLVNIAAIGTNSSTASAGATMQFLDEVSVQDEFGLPWTGSLKVLMALNGYLVVLPETPEAELVAKVRFSSETGGGTPDVTYYEQSAFYSGSAGTALPSVDTSELIYVPLEVFSGYGYISYTLSVFSSAQEGLAHALFSDTLSVVDYQLDDGSPPESIGLQMSFASEQAVPEPASAALLAIGLLAVMTGHLRRRIGES